MMDPKTVVDFWFSPRARSLWFSRNQDFDDEIRARFGAAVEEAQDGGLEEWRLSAEGCLALLILLDQMARNIHRGDARAFQGDARARVIADQAIERGYDQLYEHGARHFFYMPFEHAEDMASQDRSIELFTRLRDDAPDSGRAMAEELLDYAHRHRDIIQRFGRYPHRNAVLGRPSTDEELAFLKGRRSMF